MLLDHWLTKNELSDAKAASLFGCSAMQIGRLRKGFHIPRFPLVKRIEERTGGAVTLADMRAAFEAAGTPQRAA